jgi:hypothetical protein
MNSRSKKKLDKSQTRLPAGQKFNQEPPKKKKKKKQERYGFGFRVNSTKINGPDTSVNNKSKIFGKCIFKVHLCTSVQTFDT